MSRRLKLHDFWTYLSQECERFGLGPVGHAYDASAPLHDVEGEAWFGNYPEGECDSPGERGER